MRNKVGAVHKLRLQEEGGRWSKKSTFCKLLYHRKCKRRGVGGQKKPNLVNVVCERYSHKQPNATTLLFYQIEPLKNGVSPILPFNLSRDS